MFAKFGTYIQFKINFNISLVFSNNSTIKKLLIKNSPGNRNSCIYKISTLLDMYDIAHIM